MGTKRHFFARKGQKSNTYCDKSHILCHKSEISVKLQSFLGCNFIHFHGLQVFSLTFWIWLSLSCMLWFPGIVHPFVSIQNDKCILETRVHMRNLNRFDFSFNLYYSNLYQFEISLDQVPACKICIL